MIQTFLIRLLLLPFSLLYGLIIYLRNLFYDNGVLKSSAFSVPTISVGNLSIGGTGKTPHIEYLVSMLKDYIEVATLSRGYKRKTSGFLEIHESMTAAEAGDEPLQFKRKFGSEVVVSVGESRALAIPKLMMKHPDLQVVLLDDAFQHRSIKPYINILLTDYSRLFTDDFVLPAGRLREWPGSYERADIIIVTKCPTDLSEERAEEVRAKIKPYKHQSLFFTGLEYESPYYLFNRNYRLNEDKTIGVYLVSAIANTQSLLSHVNNIYTLEAKKEYEDHHFFSNMDLANIAKEFSWIRNNKKIILTTEKDAMRLESHRAFLQERKLPVFVLPVSVFFLFGQGPEFRTLIKNRLLAYKS